MFGSASRHGGIGKRGRADAAAVHTLDLINCDDAGTLCGLLQRRFEKTPDGEAYRQYDPATAAWKSYRWDEMHALVGRWHASLTREGLAAGDRVAVLLKNSVEWVCFDLAAQSLRLVVVPLYTTDNPENIAYVLGDCGARLLFIGETGQWRVLAPHREQFPQLSRVLCLSRSPQVPVTEGVSLISVGEWLLAQSDEVGLRTGDPRGLATIVYTSGTTGRAKGVMLSHHNILANAEAVSRHVPAYREDVFLSFLPLSHAFERTTGYILPMMAGSCVAYARSIQDLPDDLLAVRPTVLVSVPRIYERVYSRVQQQLVRNPVARTLFRWAETLGWRRFEATLGRGERPGVAARLLWPLLRRLVADRIVSRLGGRLRVAVSGGAALHPAISRCFIALGLTLLQGYGLTEASPVVTANREDDNVPESVGTPLGGVELRVGAKDELLVRGHGVMLGYWNRPQDSRTAIDADGWLHTGDQARIDGRGHVFIRGRLKEILVMSTGEKVAPADIEAAITQDPLYEQVMVVGEGMPYLAALVVLNTAAWRDQAAALGLDPDSPDALTHRKARDRVVETFHSLLHSFPGHAQVRAVWLTLEPWTIDDGLITPTLKLRRTALEIRYADAIRKLYAGHAIPV